MPRRKHSKCIIFGQKKAADTQWQTQSFELVQNRERILTLNDSFKGQSDVKFASRDSKNPTILDFLIINVGKKLLFSHPQAPWRYLGVFEVADDDYDHKNFPGLTWRSVHPGDPVISKKFS